MAATCKNMTTPEIPADVREKILRFVRAGVAAAAMRGKSYLSLGNVSMGIAGSLVDHGFFERFLGMRVETVDMVEFVRRIERNIFDPVEFDRAMAWTKANCREGKDYNSPENTFSAAEKERVWQWSVKMAMIARDLMIGNPRLDELGHGEEALGHNALAGGFQGQRQWTDHLPNGDFMEAVLNSSFDWNGIRQPFMLATENDCFNGAAMLFGHLLTGTAQVFADVRTYWSPAAVKKATGYELTGAAAGGLIHLINSGAAALDGAGRQQLDGRPALKPFWEISDAEAEECLKATTWHAAITEYFRGGGFSSHFVTSGGMPITMSRLNLVQGLGPVLQIAEGWTFELPEKVHDVLDLRTNPTWPTTWFAPRLSGRGAFTRRLHGDERLGGQPRGVQLRTRRGRSDHLGVDAADTRVHAQRAGGGYLSPQHVERLRHGGPGGGRFPRLCEFRSAVWSGVSRWRNSCSW